MRIAVLMKQTAALNTGVTESGGPLRSAENTVVNPFDLMALETAMTWRQQTEAKVEVYTMGPLHAVSVLEEARRLGADVLRLISDPLYTGSDTYVTARILAAAVTMYGPYDLILCGERAVDGETGQVPGELSAMLGIPFVSSVIAAEWRGKDELICKADLNGDQTEATIQVKLPCVLSISCGMSGIMHPYLPNLAELARSRSRTIEKLDNRALQFMPQEVGMKGSPTRVRSVRRVDWTRTCRKLKSAETAAREVFQMLHDTRFREERE